MASKWSSTIAGELFKLMTGVDMVHVPYKGAPPALIDLISGRISLIFASLPSAITHVRNEISKWSKVVRAAGIRME